MPSPSARFSFLLRPSVWVALISVLAYWDDTALHGNFVYDDAGSVVRNVVVNNAVPWTQAFYRDFWGTSLSEVTSHKSFRPITTLSFKLNYLLCEQDTYWYHVVNVVLHGIVTGLVVEAAAFVFDSSTATKISCATLHLNAIAQVVTGLLFGLHPVHAEAVSNITSRGELFMSIFFLLAFISYASHVDDIYTSKTTTASMQWPKLRSLLAIYVIPLVCMTLSLLSKEQGATTLMTLVAYDFVKHYESVRQYFRLLLQQQRDASAWRFFKRTLLLALQTIALCLWRIWINGETSPDFIRDQNPAGFATDRFTRVFSVNWVYCLYIRDMVFPQYLSCDWSGRSIDLIDRVTDVRILAVLALWVAVAACVTSLFVGPPKGASERKREARRVVLVAVFAFVLCPFLLSSNLLVVVGLMKADRVIYLPLLGFCMLEALLLQMLGGRNVAGSVETSDTNTEKILSVPRDSGVRWWAHVLILAQLVYFGGRVHSRNVAWSHSLRLWHAAYEVNPKSHHTMYNYGYELSLLKHYPRAERVLRPIASARVDGPSNTFVYAMVLYNLRRCEQANQYIDEAMKVLEEQKRDVAGPRNLPQALARSESNLLVARAHCAPDLAERGKILYDAVQVDPSNEYAVQQAQAFLQNQMGAKRMAVTANPIT